ncbi:LOW QUALITY PROTEIN: leucine-rich repeat-containing protein 53 [Sorex fumeus]|uniref:LOW QUALITY PROTEIN: leucine-rich repeat-containing protein 53 n=1 Tax=Sorex fumeus TaxID=62283 RepID=UPI0024AE4023|nr:LOW QUALITY PROTEIN: leucine-rich repeat-containing protein 53 [Sorex fumeus]
MNHFQFVYSYHPSGTDVSEAAPVTTKVLIIADGYVSFKESTNVSLFNLALFSLTRNGMEVVLEDALPGFSKLQMLLLEHNQIYSSLLTVHSFSKHYNLQILELSIWISLISCIGKDDLQSLPQPKEMDPSRNMFVHMPYIFNSRKQLILLSLDKNEWSCSCEIHSLAPFLRNYMKSSVHTSINAKDLNCQLLITTAMAAAKNVLRLSDTSCDSKAPNLTLVLKDGRALLPGHDVALLTVLGLAGAVGLTCLGLVIFNWKLQQGKANEHISENLCCRTSDESLCAHEARNYHAQGYCNCHLTQENEIKVMSIVGSRKEMPLSQENSHQVALASESTVLDRSFRNLKGKSHGADSTFFYAGGRLLKSACSEPPETMAAFNEAGLLTRYCPERFESLRNLEPGKDQPKTLPQYITTVADTSNDTFSRRYATPASGLARKNLEKHLTNESWQPPIEKGDNGLQPHRQRHFITSSSSKPCEPEEHYAQKILEKHRSKYHDPCGLLKQNRPRYFQPSNSLICKYVPCDQFLDYMKKKKPNHRDHSKPEKEQFQINSAIEKFLMNEDNMKLSNLPIKIKETYTPKKFHFHNFGLAEKNRFVISPKSSTHWKQTNQSSHTIKTQQSQDLKKHNNPQVKNQGEKWFTDPQILKRKRTNQSDLKGKFKGQNLRIKLNVHPFRKVRVHPEKILPVLPKKRKHVLFPNKLSKASDKEAKINLMTSVDFHQQPESNSYVRFTSKPLPCKHAPKQTPYYKENTKKALLLSTNLSLVSQSSVEDKGCHDGHIPAGNSSTLPQPILMLAEYQNSHTQLSTEQMEDSTHLSLEVPSYLPAIRKSIPSVLPCHHSREVTDQASTESTKHLEQDKSMTTDQVSWSLGNQTQLLGVHKTGTDKEHTPDKNQTFQQVEQDSSYEILGERGKLLMTRPQILHKIAETCLMDEEHDMGNKSLKTETGDFILIPRTQSKDSLTLAKINSIPYQNRTELPKDISTSLPTQAIWQLTNKSEEGIDRTDALPRDDGTEALEIKIIAKEEGKTPDKSMANSSTSIQTVQMTLKGTTKEKQRTWGKGKSEKHESSESSSGETTITAKELSVTRSHGTENRVLCSESESDLQINKKTHDLRDNQNIQPDTDNGEHEEGASTMETQEVLSLLPDLKNSGFEKENEVSQIPRKNEAENSVPKPMLHLPTAEYANTSLLESEQNNSNNNHFLP